MPVNESKPISKMTKEELKDGISRLNRLIEQAKEELERNPRPTEKRALQLEEDVEWFNNLKSQYEKQLSTL